MDHETRMAAARQQDPELCARIVRNIAALEDDYIFAWGPLSERLMREAAAVFHKAAPEPWVVTGSDSNVTLSFPDWRMARGPGQNDAWLELADVVEDDEAHSWTAVVVSAGPTKFCLELKVRRGLTSFAQALTPKDKLVANLLKAGFERDEASGRLYIPIAIEAERLAQGFEFNDLGEALAPLRKAVELAVAAKTDLDALIESLREKAKRK